MKLYKRNLINAGSISTDRNKTEFIVSRENQKELSTLFQRFDYRRHYVVIGDFPLRTSDSSHCRLIARVLGNRSYEMSISNWRVSRRAQATRLIDLCFAALGTSWNVRLLRNFPN